MKYTDDKVSKRGFLGEKERESISGSKTGGSRVIYIIQISYWRTSAHYCK